MFFIGMPSAILLVIGYILGVNFGFIYAIGFSLLSIILCKNSPYRELEILIPLCWTVFFNIGLLIGVLIWTLHNYDIPMTNVKELFLP